MGGLDEAGDVVHISKSESAVGGLSGELVEFFDYRGTGEGEQER
jgi:hypothetical protein